jgi:hypothetical protein
LQNRSWIKRNAPVLELIYADRQRRNKGTQDAFHRMFRNAPDAEKTKDVIDTERIEIITHLQETLAPPFKTVFLHAVPVVGRETPVLPFYRKIVRRRPGLLIHVVQIGRRPRIATVPENTDGNITF